MEVFFKRCAALDVHKETLVACVLIQGGGKVQKEVRTFRMLTSDLLALHDWLLSCGVTHVALEGTGAYWKPVLYLLEGTFTVWLVNALHFKSVPGRRGDIEDCEWLADLLSYGLLRESFIPPEPSRELRDLLRYRKSLGEERTGEWVRIQRIVEAANRKLPPGVPDGMGDSLRAALEALFSGVLEPAEIEPLARGRIRDQLALLREALQRSPFPAHHRFMLEQVLLHLDFLNEAFEQVSQEVQKQIAPFLEEVQLLKARPEAAARLVETPPKGRLLVICANCKRIRDAGETWSPIENYLKENFATQFSHTVCPDCGKVLYPDIFEESKEDPPGPSEKF